MAGTTHAKEIAVSKTFPPSRNLKAKVVLQPVWRLVRGAYMGSDVQMDSGRAKRLRREQQEHSVHGGRFRKQQGQRSENTAEPSEFRLGKTE